MRYVLLTLIIVGALWVLFYTARMVERRNSITTLRRLNAAEKTLGKIEEIALQNVDIDPSQGLVTEAISNYRKEVVS